VSTTDSTTAEPGTGEIPAVEDAPLRSGADAATVMTAILPLIPPGRAVSVVAFLDLTLVDVEIKAESAEDAAAIAALLPWEFGPRNWIDPYPEYDHYLWDGVIQGRSVRVAGLQALPGGEQS
jgi:hypothetical protein